MAICSEGHSRERAGAHGFLIEALADILHLDITEMDLS